jgi:hypothetical protein
MQSPDSFVGMQPLPVNPDFEALGKKVLVHRQHGLHHARHAVLAVDDQTAHTRTGLT